jgi:hypothetical protein
MKNVRPNKEYAKLLVQQTYPGIEIKQVQSGDRTVVDPSSPSVFKVHHLKEGKKTAFVVSFQRTKKGNWIPRPPLLEILP